MIHKDKTAKDDIVSQKEFLQIARDHTAAAKEKPRLYANKTRRHKELEVGQLVMVKKESVSANRIE